MRVKTRNLHPLLKKIRARKQHIEMRKLNVNIQRKTGRTLQSLLTRMLEAFTVERLA